MMHRVHLQELLRRDAIELLFQPIFDITVTPPRMWAVEALAHGPAGSNFETAAVLFDYVRLKHEEISVDRHCVARALRAAAALPSDVRISLNVHAVTIEKDPAFGELIALEASSNGIDPQRVILEIVEQSRYWRTSWMTSAVERLRELGLSVALDDIGCGYCNYRMIVELHPQYLKLDRYFVSGCAHENSRRAVLRSIQLLAKEIGARVVAEGVEDESELKTVRAIGIELAQGFALARPQRAQDLVREEMYVH